MTNAGLVLSFSVAQDEVSISVFAEYWNFLRVIVVRSDQPTVLIRFFRMLVDTPVASHRTRAAHGNQVAG